MRPVATGGSTNGNDTTVSTTVRPGNRRRASSHPSATPGGSMIRVAREAIVTLKSVTSTSSAFIASDRAEKVDCLEAE